MNPLTAAYVAALAASAAVLAVRLGVVWLNYHRQRDQLDAEPRCATCGYILAHRASAICPECGSDVRERGLITSRARPRVGIAPLYVLLTLIGLPIAMWVGAHLARWQPMFGWRYHYSQMVAVSQAADGSFGPPRFAVQSEGRMRLLKPRPDYVWVYRNTDGSGQPMFVVDLDSEKFAVVDASGQRSPAQPITVAQVAAFLRSRSPEIPEPQIESASERIVTAVRAAMTSDLPATEVLVTDPWNGTSFNYSTTDRVVITTGLLSWALLSAVLFGLLWRLRLNRLQAWKRAWRIEAERLGTRESRPAFPSIRSGASVDGRTRERGSPGGFMARSTFAAERGEDR